MTSCESARTGALTFNSNARAAQQNDATIYFVYCAEPPLPMAAGPGGGYAVALDTDAEFAQLQAIEPTEEGVLFEHQLLDGSPTYELNRFARDNDIDLIVMSTHGRTGLSRAVMGSVAESIVRKAPCPVLVVRVPKVRNQNDPVPSQVAADKSGD